MTKANINSKSDGLRLIICGACCLVLAVVANLFGWQKGSACFALITPWWTMLYLFRSNTSTNYKYFVWLFIATIIYLLIGCWYIIHYIPPENPEKFWQDILWYCISAIAIFVIFRKAKLLPNLP